MIQYKKLSAAEKHNRYGNMIQRCYNEDWQAQWGEGYKDVTVCKSWLEDKHAYFKFLDDEYYIVGDNQMDIDHNIIDYNNTEYSPDKCLIVPHYVNSIWNSLKVGKSSIVYDAKNNLYNVKVSDRGELIKVSCQSYNEALTAFCNIKQAIVYELAEDLKDEIPEKVYAAMVNTDVAKINEQYFLPA